MLRPSAAATKIAAPSRLAPLGEIEEGTMMTKTQTKLAMLGLAVLTAVPTALAQGS